MYIRPLFALDRRFVIVTTWGRSLDFCRRLAVFSAYWRPVISYS